MDVTESDLPGVGKKHEVNIGGGQQLVIVTHNSGKREVFRRASADSDSEKLFELTDKLARQVGTLLEGAYFQPVETSHVETLLSEGTLLEWYAVEADSPLVGETLAGANVGQRTGVTVVAIQRGDDVSPGPTSTVEIEDGDTLWLSATRQLRVFEKLWPGTEMVRAEPLGGCCRGDRLGIGGRSPTLRRSLVAVSLSSRSTRASSSGSYCRRLSRGRLPSLLRQSGRRIEVTVVPELRVVHRVSVSWSSIWTGCWTAGSASPERGIDLGINR